MMPQTVQDAIPKKPISEAEGFIGSLPKLNAYCGATVTHKHPQHPGCQKVLVAIIGVKHPATWQCMALSQKIKSLQPASRFR